MKKYVTILFFLLLSGPWAHSHEARADSLVVAVYNKPPFGEQYADGSFGGLMVELWEDIARDLDLQYHYVSTDMETLMDGLHKGEYDVGLGAISITPQREELVDFSQAVNPSGTGLAVSQNSVTSGVSRSWYRIFISLIRLILAISAVLFLASGIIWMVERRSKKPSDRKITSLQDAFWWSAVTMSTVGYGDKVPDSWTGKALAMVWIFVSIILISLFTANASAILSKAQVEIPIQSEEDLRGVRVGAAEGSSGEEYLIREKIPYIPYPSLESALEAMIRNELDAVVSNVPVLLYMNRYKYPKQLAIPKKLLLKNNMGIALKEESSLREEIDRILLQKITEPRWQQSVYKYLGPEFFD